MPAKTSQSDAPKSTKAEKAAKAEKPAKAEKKITFDLVDHIAVLSSKPKGWQREVNIVRWNGGQAKLDIRDWDAEHQKMSKGITLSGDEVAVLKSMLEDYDPYEHES